MYDVSLKHRIKIDENKNRLYELKKSNPNDYFNLPEFRKICEENRQANMEIEQYDRMIKAGVKF